MRENCFYEQVPVRRGGEYDVLVAGGGMAGCAAALAAARAGRRVLLVEKTINLGGLATNGLVVYYNPSLCDRQGRRIIGGLAEELMWAATRHGGGTIPEGWSYRQNSAPGAGIYRSNFLVANMVAALDEALLEAGVTILLDSVCCAVSMEDGVCKGVSVENKGGRSWYSCGMLIDTTGDLDLFYRAGAPCVEDLNWNSFWTLGTDLTLLEQCVEKQDIQGLLKVRSYASGMDGKDNPPGLRQYTADTGEEVTAFILDGRAYLRKALAQMDPRREMVVTLPSQAQYRTTRRIEAAYLLEEKDRNCRQPDAVGCACTHKYGGLFLEFPYRTLVSPGYRNMLTAGRTIASTGQVRGLTRLIAPSAVTGEAAGTAAAMALGQNCDVNALPVGQLQAQLLRQGCILHYDEGGVQA